jgi:hypothetical protein
LCLSVLCNYHVPHEEKHDFDFSCAKKIIKCIPGMGMSPNGGKGGGFPLRGKEGKGAVSLTSFLKTHCCKALVRFFSFII